MGTRDAVEAIAVRKRFGAIEALSGVTLRVATGTVFGLLGPNGAGKTTLVRVLTTLLRPDQGEARVLGLDVGREPDRVRAAIGLAGQQAAVDETLTGRENLELVGRLYHLRGAEARRRAAEAVVRLALTDAADRPVKTYSGGMRRRLDLGASLVGRPRVLFLDEPTTGLDPRSRRQVWGLVRELVRDGTTVLLTTQYLEEADALADRVALIDRGRVVAEGTPGELKARLAGAVLEITVVDPAQVARAVEAIRGIGAGVPEDDPGEGRLRVSVADGAASLVAAVRRLDGAGVAVADVALRRPSLDDVFLALTGHAAPRPAPTTDATDGAA